MSDETNHSEKQLGVFNQFLKRLKKERFINNQASVYYSKLDQNFVIPGIVITGLSSVVSFIASSDMLNEDEKWGVSILVGILTAVATILQSLSSSFGFQVKKEAFQNSADVYDSLITKIEFEICNPNEEFGEFCNNLEQSILTIKNDCKYLAPLKIHKLWEQNQLKSNVNSDSSLVRDLISRGSNETLIDVSIQTDATATNV